MDLVSIRLHKDDIRFCKGKGKNLSVGVRYCIKRTKETEETQQEIPEGFKRKLLGIMEF
mgnify:CR=1 FL=1